MLKDNLLIEVVGWKNLILPASTCFHAVAASSASLIG